MNDLDPRSIRKGSMIRLDDTTEGSEAFVGGLVGHVDPDGRVIIDHMGTFIVEGLGGKPREGYTVYRLAFHKPPKPDPLAETVWSTSRDDGEGISAILADKIAAAVRDKFTVIDLQSVDAEHTPEPEWKHQAVLADWLGRRFLAGTNGKGDRRLYGEDGSFIVPPAEGLRPLVVIDPAQVDVAVLRDVYANEAHVAADNDGILAVLTVLGIEAP